MHCCAQQRAATKKEDIDAVTRWRKARRACARGGGQLFAARAFFSDAAIPLQSKYKASARAWDEFCYAVPTADASIFVSCSSPAPASCTTRISDRNAPNEGDSP